MGAPQVRLCEDAFDVARDDLESIIELLKSGEAQDLSHSALERLLSERGQELLRKLLQAHLDARGPGEAAAPVRGADGVAREQLLTEPRSWACLDYRCVSSPNLHGGVSASVTRRGHGHGVGVWFDSELADDVKLSNAPGEPELIYGQAFFPWPQAVALEAGDTVEVLLRADLVGEDYVWGWETSVRRAASPERVDIHFRQSNFLQSPLSTRSLARRSSAHVPRLSEDGLCARFVMERMDGTVSLESLAHALCSEFPERFRSWQEGLNYVSELSARYSQ